MKKVSTNEGNCLLVEVGALISWCIYSYRIVMLLVPYMWASMTLLPDMWATMTFWPKHHVVQSPIRYDIRRPILSTIGIEQERKSHFMFKGTLSPIFRITLKS